MPIYRCNKCEFVCEDASSPVGSKVGCARCGTPSTVYGTVFYVEMLAKRYLAAVRELQALKPKIESIATPDQHVGGPLLQQLLNVDTHNTALLATPEQHAPLKEWFSARQIETKLDYALVDTSGFFDDAAQLIGANYALFAELMDRVCWAYRKSHSSVNLELKALSQKDTQAITHLCSQFYDHTLFARYHYQKPEKIVRLTLQTAPAVRQFFEGGWLEWYAFMQLIEQIKARGRDFSCARGVKVVFPNEDLHELDVVLLPQGAAPICIECKSGEFRRDIDKYLRLRKRLGLVRSRFILCAADLSDEQVNGLNAMYELTFVNLNSLGKQLQSLL